MQLLIIDALNLIRRIYAAQERPYLQIASGISAATQQQVMHNTNNAIAQAVEKMLKLTAATHAICVFDGAGDSWRHQLYPDYKAGRNPMPTALAAGMDSIKATILQAGVQHTEQAEIEADDLIASLASKVAAQQQQVIIVSTDKGFLQLLNQHIRVYDYFGRRFLDQQHVQQKFEVSSQQLINYWSLVGDSSNNIPGVTGIGPKSALEILQYPSLKQALHSEQLNKKLKLKLQQQIDEFKLYRQLLTLQQDLAVGLNAKQLRLTPADH